jgi:hypothetical protein
MVLGSAGIFGGNEKSVGVTAPKSPQTHQKQSQGISAFSPHLRDALIPNASHSQKRAVIANTLATTDANASLNLVNGLPPITTPTGNTSNGSTAGSGSGSVTPRLATTTDQLSTLEILKASLIKAGVDTTGMQFTQHQDLVTYPGGSYVNDLIDLQVGGKSHTYMANLVALDPKVTVVEIEQLLAGARG